jgi:hypothetical protein
MVGARGLPAAQFLPAMAVMIARTCDLPSPAGLARSAAAAPHFALHPIWSTKTTIASSVKDGHDLHHILLNAMDDDVGQSWHRQEPDAARTRPPRIRKLFQSPGAALDSIDNAPRSLRIVSRNIGMDTFQVP